MRSYIVFTKKELIEYGRTYKFFILFTIFVALGFMNPLTAKFMPKILESFMPEEIEIQLPPPSSLDSWAQFFKNVTQTGLFVAIIIFSGMMSREYEKGTLVNMITKGLPRQTVILSKFTASTLLWTLSYWTCFVITHIYTMYFWKGETVLELATSTLFLYLFGIMLISVLLIGSTLFKNSYGGLLFTGGFIAILFLLKLSHKIDNYNPLQLANQNINLLSGNLHPSELKSPLFVCCTVIILSIISSILIFDKKQI